MSFTHVLTPLPDRVYDSGGFFLGQVRPESPCIQRPPHIHDGYVFEFVEHGQIGLKVTNKTTTYIRHDHCYLIVPGTEHTHQGDPATRTLFFIIDPSEIAAVAREFGFDTPRPFIRPFGAEIYGVLRRMAVEAAAPGIGTGLMLQSLRLQLLIYLFRASYDSVLPDATPEIRRVIDLMHSHYADPLTLDDLATAAMMSRYHFVRVFKHQIGQTPFDYLRGVRLERARDLLRESSLAVSTIAHSTGFATAAHFSAAFRARFGYPPSEECRP
jgi:AraC-like DNA-binding protein